MAYEHRTQSAVNESRLDRVEEDTRTTAKTLERIWMEIDKVKQSIDEHEKECLKSNARIQKILLFIGFTIVVFVGPDSTAWHFIKSILG